MRNVCGSLIRQFWHEGFPEGYYYEGDDSLDPDEVLNTGVYRLKDFGILRLENPAEERSDMPDFLGFDTAFRWWYKQQTTTVLTVILPKDKQTELEAFLKTINGKINRKAEV